MAKLRKQNQTAHPLQFLLVQSADHTSPLTGAVPAVKLSKNGGAGVTPVGAVTEIDATGMPGWYQVAGNATDSNTLGPLILHATAASGDPMDTEFQVVGFDPDDAAALGLSGFTTIQGYTDTLEAGVGAVQGGVTALQTSANLIAGYTDTLEASAASLSAAVGTVQSTSNTIAGYTDTLETAVAAVQSAVNTVSGYVDTEVGAIKTVTDKINTMLEQSGSDYRLSVAALTNVPTASDTVLEVVTATGAGGPEVTATGSGG